MNLTHIKDANNCWTVVIENESYNFDSTHPEYLNLVNAVKTANSEGFISILSVGTMVADWSQGSFKFEDGNLYYQGELIHEVMTNRIINMIKEGFDHHPMLRFLERLFKNPSYRNISSFHNVYTFLSKECLPITPDGYFLAYKYISKYSGPDGETDKNGNMLMGGDFVDSFTGKSYRNNIGDKPTMPRHQVDDNFNAGCSAGLHVGSKEYSGQRSNSLICKVDPADVVSVPNDCNCQKVRTCSYHVVGLFEKELDPHVSDEYEEDDDYDYDYDYDYPEEDSDEDDDIIFDEDEDTDW